MMQQLAAQLGLTSNASTDGGRNALLEQILTGGALPLAELMSQTHQEHGELQRCWLVKDKFHSQKKISGSLEEI